MAIGCDVPAVVLDVGTIRIVSYESMSLSVSDNLMCIAYADCLVWQALSVLRQRLDKKGVDMIIAHIPPSRLYIQHLLVAHGVAAAGVLRGPPEESVAPGSCLVFDSLSTALQYCEEALLCAAVQFDVCPVGLLGPALLVSEHDVCDHRLLHPLPLTPAAVPVPSQPTRDNMSLSAVLEANRALEWREKALLPGSDTPKSVRCTITERGTRLHAPGTSLTMQVFCQTDVQWRWWRTWRKWSAKCCLSWTRWSSWRPA